MKPVILGVVVAAGASTRMGETKALVPVGGRPMLQWVVDAAEASGLDRVVVVTGPGDAEIRTRVRVNRAYFVRNPVPERGTMSSLREGVVAAGDVDAVMKLVADQPEVTSADIDAVIAAWDPGQHTFAVPSYSDGVGHPLLVARELLEQVLGDDGNRLLWGLMESEAERVLYVPIDRPRPIDVNTPDDLAQVAARLA